MSDVSRFSDADLLAMLQRGADSGMTAATSMTGDDMTALATDVAKSAAIGPVKGAIGMAGLPADARSMFANGAKWAFEKLGMTDAAGALDALREIGGEGATSQNIRKGVEQYTGPLYEPQTRAGRYAQTVGEMVPAAAMGPGGLVRRAVAGAIAPGVASEAAGEAAKPYGGTAETVARFIGGAGGSLVGSGAVSAVNASRAGVPGMTPGASRVLEKSVTPGAEARFTQLGPEGMLLEGAPASLGVAQGIATRPGQAQSQIVDALTERQRGANARLSGDLDATLGPATPLSHVEAGLDAQRASLGPMYERVIQTNNPVNFRPLADQIRQSIPTQAGKTQRVMREAFDMLHSQTGGNGPAILKTSPREALNIRMALDDLIEQTPETNAKLRLTEVRRAVDAALQDAVPDIKILDNTFSGLKKESEALTRGSDILQSGREAIHPADLAAERRGMRLPEREAMRIGARAELDRLTGTKANDISALRQVVMSDGDWNRAKLAQIFGPREADRIFKSVDREAAFQEAYRKVVENSQTAQRLGGVEAVKAETREAPSLRDTTTLGAVLGVTQKTANKVLDMVSRSKRSDTDSQLAKALIAKGPERDELVKSIREAQRKRGKGGTTAGNELARVLLSVGAAAGSQ